MPQTDLIWGGRGVGWDGVVSHGASSDLTERDWFAGASHITSQYGEFEELVRQEIEYQARRLAPHPSLCLYSGNNESPDFENLPLFVATQLGTCLLPAR